MLTPCLGRQQVQERLDAALSGGRWVSVIGPPGSGKTLLVRHAAATFPSTTWVNARGLRGSEAVITACLDALEVETVPGDSPNGALTRALDGSDRLLVVDGVELDQDTLGPAFQSVVEATSDVRLAVTALTMAGQPAERVVRVAPLPVPSSNEPLTGPAVDLFLARIGDAGGHPVDLGAHEDDVRRLLVATGGLPLLIEQIAVQIALVGVTNVVPTASLSEAVHASYELLDEEHQRCFRRMTQLSSPVGIDVLAAVTEVSRERASELATGLVRRSLLEVLPDGHFDMLVPIRRHGTFLTASTDDGLRVRELVLAWADAVAPKHMNTGAADAPWLSDLPVMRSAILGATADDATRDTAYRLANRVFSSLYTSMRAREAVEIMEGVLTSGDGPAAIGAQVARRAGIAASEVRGTYEGLWLLDRADQHATASAEPSAELAKTASIRAEMHLDAGDLHQAEREARRAIDLDGEEGFIFRQATRTLTDVHVSRGLFPSATRYATSILAGTSANDERWVTLSGRTLLARIAAEQGRVVEAASAARAVVSEARNLAEDRVGLLAETLLREVDPGRAAREIDRSTLPWAVRVPVLVQDARDLLRVGDLERATGTAADVVVLADSTRLGRDACEARLILGRAFLASGDLDQAATTLVAALDQATVMAMPLRAADALDALAEVADLTGRRDARRLATAAATLRATRHAVGRTWPRSRPVEPGRSAPEGWVVDGDLTTDGLRAATSPFTSSGPDPDSPLELLTAAERAVADRVADGLTSRRIADELFVSPRTVDAHLTNIYRKLDIGSRARLAAIVVDHR